MVPEFTFNHGALTSFRSTRFRQHLVWCPQPHMAMAVSVTPIQFVRHGLDKWKCITLPYSCPSSFNRLRESRIGLHSCCRSKGTLSYSSQMEFTKLLPKDTAIHELVRSWDCWKPADFTFFVGVSDTSLLLEGRLAKSCRISCELFSCDSRDSLELCGGVPQTLWFSSYLL